MRWRDQLLITDFYLLDYVDDLLRFINLTFKRMTFHTFTFNFRCNLYQFV